VNTTIVETDELTTDALIERFHKHVSAVRSNTLSVKNKVWSIYMAKGLHKLLSQRAIDDDDEKAGNVALGAPHFVTFNAGTIEAMLEGIDS